MCSSVPAMVYSGDFDGGGTGSRLSSVVSASISSFISFTKSGAIIRSTISGAPSLVVGVAMPSWDSSSHLRYPICFLSTFTDLRIMFLGKFFMLLCNMN